MSSKAQNSESKDPGSSERTGEAMLTAATVTTEARTPSVTSQCLERDGDSLELRVHKWKFQSRREAKERRFQTKAGAVRLGCLS